MNATRKYESARAFRQALEARLKVLSETEGATFSTVCAQER